MLERFKNEIVPVMIESNGQTLVVDTDEQPRTDASCRRFSPFKSFI